MMHYAAVMFSAALLSPLSTSAAGPLPIHDTARVETRLPADDVAQTYDELRSMSASERTQIFQQLPSSTKAAVWSHHLLAAMVKHPECTDEQRAIIQQTLALLTPGLFDMDSSGPEWKELVDPTLRSLSARAKAAFGGSEAHDLFARFGPDESGVNDEAATHQRSPGQLLRPGTTEDAASFPNCTCSVISDYCD